MELASRLLSCCHCINYYQLSSFNGPNSTSASFNPQVHHRHRKIYYPTGSRPVDHKHLFLSSNDDDHLSSYNAHMSSVILLINMTGH